MTDDKSENNSDAGPQGKLVKIEDSQPAVDTRRFRQVFIVVAVLFLILLAVLAASSWFLYQQIQSVSRSTSNTAENTKAIDLTLDKKFGQLNSDLGQLRIQQQDQSDSLTALYRRFPKDTEGWALSEVEYLLVIASHRLLLEKDITTALSAMELADLRLRDLGDPALIPVREQLMADMNTLRAVERVDISGLAIYLADLIDRSGALPLKSAGGEVVGGTTEDFQAEQDATERSWRDLPATIWKELKSLVVIKHSGETRRALLLPDQEYFLYQNLRLELENARLAVLHRDTENLRVSISLLMDWLGEYFDNENTAVINVMDTLEKMSALQLDSEIPDISSSLETLRAFMHEKELSIVQPDRMNNGAGSR